MCSFIFKGETLFNLLLQPHCAAPQKKQLISLNTTDHGRRILLNSWGVYLRQSIVFATVFFIQELHAWWNMVLCRNITFQSFIRGRHTWNSNFEWCILPWFVSFSTISYALHRSFVPKFSGLLPNFLRKQISRVPSSITRMCTRNNRIRMYIKLL